MKINRNDYIEIYNRFMKLYNANRVKNISSSFMQVDRMAFKELADKDKIEFYTCSDVSLSIISVIKGTKIKITCIVY